MAIIKCPKCKRSLSVGESICKGCGTDISVFEKTFCKHCNGRLLKCPKCGRDIPDEVNICIDCGYDIGKIRTVLCTCCDKSYKSIDDNNRKDAVICPECGKKVEIVNGNCPECGYPMASQKRNANKSNTNRLRSLHSIRTFLLTCTVICFILSMAFFSKGYNVKNEYYNSENYPSLNKNAYVGGDAYNYIINGTYCTAYFVVASNILVGSIILMCSAVIVTLKIADLE